jgi:hypothetical protein
MGEQGCGVEEQARGTASGLGSGGVAGSTGALTGSVPHTVCLVGK